MHTSYLERFGHLPDFEVTYRLFSPEEGGRKMPAHQGVMWNFIYDEQPKKGSFMIFPEIIDVDTREVFISDSPVPEYGIATMWIANPQLRSYHQQYIKPGVRGYFTEGPRKIGVCEVTRIIGLFTNPS